ncbi:MAG: undecaprenyldiphospho-muramoylpentapeptide beta-N-acetylglucosaminyltransferase [Thermodesulfobacteriota bacterium]
MSGAVLIAGGGTGGHLFPGVAVAQALRALRPDLAVTFVSTGKALESRALAEAGFALAAIPARALRGRGLVERLKALMGLPLACLAAARLIARLRPGLVLAVGGYAAFPLGLMARLMGAPLVVQEQNALGGLTNRILARLARRVFISFPEAQAQFPAAKCELTGNPVRADLLDQARVAAAARPDPAVEFRVLVLGGSQGAHSLNLALTAALAHLADRRERLFFIHQTGAADRAMVAAAYAERGFRAQVGDFFADMGRLYGQAHLVVCRAGAGTLTELAACGRAAVCAPYPHAAGDHQTKNARSREAAGAALVIPDAELTGQRAAAVIAGLMDDPGRLIAMEAAALALGRPDAARRIAGRCLELMREAA